MPGSEAVNPIILHNSCQEDHFYSSSPARNSLALCVPCQCSWRTMWVVSECSNGSISLYKYTFSGHLSMGEFDAYNTHTCEVHAVFSQKCPKVHQKKWSSSSTVPATSSLGFCSKKSASSRPHWHNPANLLVYFDIDE